MTPSRQESDHPTSSSSSSTTPTTTVLSDSETRANEYLSGIDSHSVPLSSSHVERIERGDPLLPKPTKNTKPSKNENHEKEQGNPLCSDIPEWLREFRENLVDDRVPERRDSHASSSREPSSEPTPARSVDLGKHSSLKTESTRFVRGPKLQGPRAEDAVADPYLVLSESCESRNNHRHAIVVQDLATQWIQSYPCKNRDFSGDEGACKSSWSQIGNLESFLSDGRHHMRDVLGNNLMDRSFRLVHWLSITLSLRKTSQESINLERKSYLDCSSDTHCTRGEFGRVT